MHGGHARLCARSGPGTSCGRTSRGGGLKDEKGCVALGLNSASRTLNSRGVASKSSRDVRVNLCARMFQCVSALRMCAHVCVRACACARACWCTCMCMCMCMCVLKIERSNHLLEMYNTRDDNANLE